MEEGKRFKPRGPDRRPRVQKGHVRCGHCEGQLPADLAATFAGKTYHADCFTDAIRALPAEAGRAQCAQCGEPLPAKAVTLAGRAFHPAPCFGEALRGIRAQIETALARRSA